MYANLKVGYRREGHSYESYAWRVDKVEPASLRIYIDENDGEGSYAVEGEEIVIPAADLLSVEPCF